MPQEYKIEESTKDMRLDKAITFLDKSLSRMTIQRLLECGKITVNR